MNIIIKYKLNVEYESLSEHFDAGNYHFNNLQSGYGSEMIRKQLQIYRLNAKIEKDFSDKFVQLLADLFYGCFLEGIFHDVPEISRIVLIFNTRSTYDINKYRPISIILVFEKIFEIILKSRIS